MVRKLHVQHDGELEVQRKLNIPDEVPEILQMIVKDRMPEQHSTFFEGLPYLAVATVDSSGNVWATLLVGAGITRVVSSTLLDIRVSLAPDDPFARSVLSGSKNQPFALMGVDFSNRRRNKAAGAIRRVRGSATQLEFQVETNESLGNCPKYITVRELKLFTRTPRTLQHSLQSGTIDLTSEARDVLNQASTIWIASKHIDNDHPERSDVGVNHRGGPPGFVRAYAEGGTWYVCIPDYSGNRFYQTLGSIQASRTAGLLIPDFRTGTLLHITGEAENLFGPDADAIMPRVNLVTRVKVTGVVLIEGAINLKQVSEDTFSPYNPPVRHLASEGASAAAQSANSNTATLVSIARLTKSTCAFTFELSRAVPYTPGSYIILSFAHFKDREYAHMNDETPQSLNDDFIRTWTVSSVEPVGTSSVTRVTCTIKLVPTGAISPFLHGLAWRFEGASQQKIPRLELPCLGMAGEFTCFSPERSVPPQMLWIAGGVGITPFLAFYEGTLADSSATDVVLLFSCRSYDVSLVSPLLARSASRAKISVVVFVSDDGAVDLAGDLSSITIVRRRLARSDLDSRYTCRPAYLCGPSMLMDSVAAWLAEANCTEIYQEKFTF